MAFAGLPSVVQDLGGRRATVALDTSAIAFDLRFSADGRTLFGIFGFPAGTAVQRFDARSGQPLGVPRFISRYGAATVLVARDGRRIVTSVIDGPTVVRDAHTLRPLKRLEIRADAVALSPDDRTLLAGAADGAVRFVELASGTVRVATERHDGPVTYAAFNRDGSVAATGGQDNRVKVWDVARAAARESFTGHTAQVSGLAFSQDSPTLFSAGLDGKVLIWDLAGDRRLGRPFAIKPFTGRMPFAVYPPGIRLSYDASPDGRTLALGAEDGTVDLLDLRTFRTRSSHRVLGTAFVASVGYMPDGRLLATDEFGQSAMLDPKTREVDTSLKGFGAATAPSLSRDRRLMAAAGPNGAVSIRTLRSGRPSGRARIYPANATSVSLSPDGRSIAVSGFVDVEIGDVATLRRRILLPASKGQPTVVQYSPDGRFVAAGSVDGSVVVWSTKSWRSRRFRAQAGAVKYLAVSPDSRTLAVGGDDGAIRLFDLPSQRPLGTPLPAIANHAAAPLFTRDGAYLLVITDAGTAYRWDVRPSSWARHACAVAGRSLTRVEWSEELPDRDYAPAC
jgi:WD40 repeat protein